MPQIVNILGEQVAFDSTGFAPSEKIIVQFDEKYKYTGITDVEVVVLKKLFQTLFSGSSAFLPGQKQPSPPCSDKEKDILLKSLEYRFVSLRNELIAERQSQSDSLRLRQIMDHIERLKQYIDFMRTTTSCQEMEEDILAESLGDLSDEQIQQLLKQFVFFILQGQHPLQTFTGRDPNPKGFVARLERKPITDFDQFLTQYKDKKYPIAPRLSKVLEATGLDVQALQNQIDSAVENKVKSILALISDVIDPSDPFWKNLDKKNLEAVVQRLLETIETLQIDLEDCEKEAANYQGAMIEISNEKDMLAEENAALQEKLRMLQLEFQRFQKTAIVDGVSKEEMEEMRNEFLRRQQILQEQKGALAEKRDAAEQKQYELETLVENLQQQLSEKQAQIDIFTANQTELTSLREKVASLEEQLKGALEKAKGCEELQVKAKALEAEVALREEQLTELRNRMGAMSSEIDGFLQEKTNLLRRISLLEGDAEQAAAFVARIEAFVESLSQDKGLVLSLLGDIQRTRSSYVSSDDPILQEISSLRSSLESSNTIEVNTSSAVAQLLKAVQEEAAEKQKELEELKGKVAEVNAKIETAQKAMEEGNTVLAQIRSGRTDLDTKGFKYASDKEFLENAIKAVEAEKDLMKAKQELEATVQTLTTKNATLTSDMTSLQERMTSEISELRGELERKSEALSAEEEKSAGLEGRVTGLQNNNESLEAEIAEAKSKIEVASAELEEEKIASAERLRNLEDTKIRECEERLATLRSEEEEKRKLLVGTQGQASNTLQAEIASLLQRITGVEGERDSYKTQMDAEKERAAKKETECEEKIRQANQQIMKLQSEIDELRGTNKKVAVLLKTAEEKLEIHLREVEELKAEVFKDTTEKEQLYEILTKITSWISSGFLIEEPVIDQHLDRKYGIHRVISAFLESLPLQETETETQTEPITSSAISAAMSRCYLVFFMTYIYARHFPSKMDSEYNYQSILTGFFEGALKDIYTKLEEGIPGKLEKVGSAIPVQLKSKYVMNLLLPLIEQMELVHEKGAKGADFLKFASLSEDQLDTLHIIHTVLKDKIRLTKDIQVTMNNYFKRRSGNADDDITNLYLRFYHETKTNKEFPVVMYIKADTMDIPKFTFATDLDFSQYLSSTVKKETIDQVSSQMGATLKKSPVFSFNLLFYLFLFVVKDYLSSVEGELTKAGCPLPQILKSKRR